MISAHEVNFQTSSSRSRTYSFKILFKALQRPSLITTDDKIVCSYNQPARIMESQHLTWKPRLLGCKNIRYLTHKPTFFYKKYVRIFNALYSTVFRKLIFLIINFFFQIQFLYSFFFSFACLALVNSLLFGYDHNELVLFHFLSNKLRFKSTLYLSWKFIEVSCETESRTEFAIGAAFLRFPISMNF